MILQAQLSFLTMEEGNVSSSGVKIHGSLSIYNHGLRSYFTTNKAE